VDLNTGVDWRVLAFATTASILTGLLCGVLPAIRGTRVAVAESLKQEGRGAVGAEGGRRGMLVGKALVAAQMAFCLLLLVVAGLFARSLRSLTMTDLGFDRDRVLTARVDTRGAGYSDDEQLRTNEEIVTDRYFETVGLRLIEGRLFRPEDHIPDSKSTIVNATMARRFFPGQSAVGKRWSYGDAIDKDAQVIVGVVEDAHYVELRSAPPNMAYPLAEASPDEVLSDIEIRTAGSPRALAQTVREALTQAEPRLPVVEVMTLSDRVDRGVSQDRMVARLTSIFGALALLLASLGLYGTISYGI